MFGFDRQPAEYRNLLWMLFTDPELRQVIADWPTQAPRILSSFRRDYARADGDPIIAIQVKEHSAHSPDFFQWWRRHEVDAPRQGVRALELDGLGKVGFEHTRLIVDEGRHLRLVVYSVQETDLRPKPSPAGWLAKERNSRLAAATARPRPARRAAGE
ncbi:hypothetical protein R6258_10090 [Halomonas sp. HP20-15]|uniref:MmyB family transcriptional regulator n=1 Tax=Halomonas sp. HP20-15 TaxID=3085901 RepID=UPI002982B6EA|nr:hypothetical protein [Halomonas sp. HP20-15]MDW5377265.1 hypothetical protein [Halomonas sp. HP20-15]